MCWGCALLVDQCLSFKWARLIYRVHGKPMVWFIQRVTCLRGKDSHKSNCGGERTLKKINDFLSSAPDNSRKNTRRRPKQACHKITYIYTSHSEMCKTQPNGPSVVPPTPSTMRYFFGICFVAQKIITVQQKNVHPFNPKSWKISVNLDWNQNV